MEHGVTVLHIFISLDYLIIRLTGFDIIEIIPLGYIFSQVVTQVSPSTSPTTTHNSYHHPPHHPPPTTPFTTQHTTLIPWRQVSRGHLCHTNFVYVLSFHKLCMGGQLTSRAG